MFDAFAALPIEDMILLALVLAGAGVIAGVVAGLLGVGGGIVMVPVLFHLFETMNMGGEAKMHLAVGTSLAAIVFTSLSSTRSHHKRQAVDWAIVKAWTPWVVLGVAMGAAFAGQAKGSFLSGLFAVLALYMSYRLGFDKKADMGAVSPKPPMAQIMPSAIGFFSTLLGIGGGTFSVPSLTAMGHTAHRAVGTAAAIGFVIGLPGAIGFALTGLEVEGRPPLSFGYLYLPALLILTPLTTLFAPLGVRLAHAMDPGPLKKVFAAFLLITALRMLNSLIGLV